ncbi:MAG: hypothetical protein ACYST6_08205 [Planctomycetota bacterium]|jgi:hypothetical protein
MKSVIRLILVLALLNLAAEAHAMVEPAPPAPHEAHEPHEPQVILTEDESIEDEMAAAKRQMRAAEKEMDIARTKIESAAGEQEKIAAEKEMDRANRKRERAGGRMAELRERRRQRDRERERQLAALLQLGRYAGPVLGDDAHAGRVLVIPADQIKTKNLVTIMEDLSVMSRILDKKLGRSQHYSVLGNLSVFSDARAGTQCIYLDGYGALFIIKVDFPLAPSVDTQEEEETEEPTDRLWEETRQEIFVGPGTIRQRRIHVQQDTEHRYDAEKVEELKRNLIKSLRHAANIRTLEPEHWLIVTVIGSGETNIDGILTDSKTGTVTVIKKDGKIVETTYEGALPGNLGSSSPTVMTIRAQKSDVDALAEGLMDLNAFRENVQIYTY